MFSGKRKRALKIAVQSLSLFDLTLNLTPTGHFFVQKWLLGLVKMHKVVTAVIWKQETSTSAECVTF